MDTQQIIIKLKNIIKVHANLTELWGDFAFGTQIAIINTHFSKDNLKVLDGMLEIAELIKDLAKFPLSMVLLLEPHIELIALMYASILLTAAMPLLVTVLGSFLLTVAGSYILIFNESSNLLHGFMPAFLKITPSEA